VKASDFSAPLQHRCFLSLSFLVGEALAPILLCISLATGDAESLLVPIGHLCVFLGDTLQTPCQGFFLLAKFSHMRSDVIPLGRLPGSHHGLTEDTESFPGTSKFICRDQSKVVTEAFYLQIIKKVKTAAGESHSQHGAREDPRGSGAAPGQIDCHQNADDCPVGTMCHGLCARPLAKERCRDLTPEGVAASVTYTLWVRSRGSGTWSHRNSGGGLGWGLSSRELVLLAVIQVILGFSCP
jgi:hypothetical protein